MEAAERIRSIFRDSLAVEVPDVTTDVIETGLLDSLALVTLLFELEQEFEITIPLDDLDLESLRTVERIVAFVDGLAEPGPRARL